MTYKEKRLEEFDEAFCNSSWWEDAENNKHSSAHSIRKFLSTSIQEALEEEMERVRGEIKEFRHKHRNLNVSSEFDIAFDNFLSSLDKLTE